jgi:hypothetical protein
MALMGTVISQAAVIPRMVEKSIKRGLWTNPTPIILPTIPWDVDTGKPRRDANKTVVAVANSAQNPALGCRGIICSPMVVITFLPQIPNPLTIPIPPKIITHPGTVIP